MKANFTVKWYLNTAGIAWKKLTEATEDEERGISQPSSSLPHQDKWSTGNKNLQFIQE